MKKTYQCTILEKVKVADNVFKIIVERPREMGPIKSGQFFNLQPGETGYPLLRRPISASMVTETTIEFVIIEKGTGTKLIRDERLVGEKLDLLGPLGNGYELTENMKKVLVVGGGIGIAPQRLLAKELRDLEPEQMTVIMGFRDTTYGLETYEELADDLLIATESGKVGHKGFITEPLKNALEKDTYDMVFACGPKAMLKSVNGVCQEAGVPVQLLMEERMACGIGACLVCTCKIKDDEKSYKNVRTCKDGPVFYGEEVIFDA